jgi:Ca-activated chloride channel family protein
MKRDLEHWGDKLSPDEERRIWSKMKSALREPESVEGTRTRRWTLRPWVTSAAVAAAAVVVVVALWRTHEPGQHYAGLPAREKAVEVKAPSEIRDEVALGEGGEAAHLPEGEVTVEPAEREESEIPADEDLKPAPQGISAEAEVEGIGAKESELPEPEREAAQDARDEEVRTRDVGAGLERLESSKMETRAEESLKQGAAEGTGPVRADMMSAEESGKRDRGKGKKGQAEDSGEIGGRILDSNGTPLAYAQVLVVGTRFGAMTDENGFFVIRNLAPGTYVLRVTVTGYEDLVVDDVEVERDRVKSLPEMRLVEDGTLRIEEPSAVGGKRSFLGRLFKRDKKEEADRRVVAADLEAVIPEMVCPPPPERPGTGYPSLTGGSRPVNDELADDMFFQHYGTNPFVDAEEDALSTFGLDVDTGSYTICRRYIREGSLPPTEAVRVEEFVNFFRKDFPPPRRDALRIHIDGMPSPFAHVQDGSYWLLRVGIRGRVIDERDRPPAQIVLVVDTSGSMGMGNRLGLLKASMDVLLDELRPDDEVGIVEFKTQARVVLTLTPFSEGRVIRRAMRELQANGSTNAEHGLKLGYEMLRERAREGRLHRIILCSDGVANEGNTGWEKILENVRGESDPISLTTIGFGMGNYNDVLLERLADAGDGGYAYVDDLREATRVLRENFTGTIQTIARDVKAQIEFDPDYVDKYRLLGYENRDVRDEDFRRDDVDAGEIGAGHEVTVLYEIKLNPEAGRRRLAEVHLRYEDPESGRVVELDESIRKGDFWRDAYHAPADLVVDACVAEFAEILRGSYWAREGSLLDVLDLLRDATWEMTSRPEVDELVDLVEKAIDLEE